MALAAAVAKARGWVDVAACRAHRWDVYSTEASYLPFRQYLAENLDHYRFISENGLAYFRAREGSDYESLGCSRLGTPALAEAPLADRHPFVLISCSSMIHRKRVERIAESLTRVRRSVTWIHLGDGPSRAAIERIAARLPDCISVELHGQASNAEVLDTYRARRPSLFVSLSESEGVPVAIMEAMGAGIPTVATAVGGVNEILTHRKNGLLLAPDPTIADVSQAIEVFVDMPDQEYRRYAQAAWDTWNREFNADTNYNQFANEVLDWTERPSPSSAGAG
jgi:glycosyltransferase involved in cell wall biosynthesis